MSFRKRFKKSYKQPPPSPIEVSFWETAKPLIPELQREVWIDKKYRVDFFIPSKKIVIELYGYQHHSTKQKLTKDAERERYLLRLGYQVVRFTGSEVFKDVQKCVNEVLLLAKIQPAKVPINANQTLTQSGYISYTSVTSTSDKPIAAPENAKRALIQSGHITNTVAPARDKPINVSVKAKPSVGSILYRSAVSVVLILVVGTIACFIVTNLFFSTLLPSSRPNPTENTELKKAITHSKLEWQNPKSPGKTEWQVTIPANEPALINFGWCATNKATLDENWSHIRYSLLVDNSYVELAPNQWEFENGNAVCRGYSEKLSGWAVGRHSFTWFYDLDQTLDNGNDVYQPGEYVIEFIVDVK